MGILRKLGATVTAAAFVGVGALTATTAASSTTLVRGKLRIDKRCMTKGRVLCINKRTRKLVYMVNGKAIQITDARFGGRKNKA